MTLHSSNFNSICRRFCVTQLGILNSSFGWQIEYSTRAIERLELVHIRSTKNKCFFWLPRNDCVIVIIHAQCEYTKCQSHVLCCVCKLCVGTAGQLDRRKSSAAAKWYSNSIFSNAWICRKRFVRFCSSLFDTKNILSLFDFASKSTGSQTQFAQFAHTNVDGGSKLNYQEQKNAKKFNFTHNRKNNILRRYTRRKRAEENSAVLTLVRAVDDAFTLSRWMRICVT